MAAIEYTINSGNNLLRGKKRAVVYRVLFLNFRIYCPLKYSAAFWISMQIGLSLLFLEFETGKHCFSCEIDFSKILPFFLRTMFHKPSLNYFSFLPLQRLQCVSSWENYVSLKFGRTFWRQIGESQLPGNVWIVLISAGRDLWFMCDGGSSSWTDWTQAT